MKARPSNTAQSRHILLCWLTASVLISLLVSASSAWQSWERNQSLADFTSLPIYFLAVWSSYLLWVPIGFLIYRIHLNIPMFSKQQPLWWLQHLGISLLVSCLHLFTDNLLLWVCLSNSFSLMLGFLEKLIRWLPYELLGYWALLTLFTLFNHRRRLLLQNASKQPQYLERLNYKVGDETHLISVEDIDYIEAYDNYVRICCGQNVHLVKQTMTHLEQHLNPHQFMRIHRSFIVNLNAVKKVSKNSKQQAIVIMKQGKSIPVSRRRKTTLKQALNNATV